MRWLNNSISGVNMAPSVSQGGQRLLGWRKMPGHGISEKRHFPNSYQAQWAQVGRLSNSIRWEGIDFARSPKLAPRSNSFAPDGHPCQSGERFVWMGGVTPPPRLWLYSEVLQAMWSPQSDHVLPLKITVGDVVPAGCSGTALALYMARDDAIVDPIPKT